MFVHAELILFAMERIELVSFACTSFSTPVRLYVSVPSSSASGPSSGMLLEMSSSSSSHVRILGERFDEVNLLVSGTWREVGTKLAASSTAARQQIAARTPRAMVQAAGVGERATGGDWLDGQEMPAAAAGQSVFSLRPALGVPQTAVVWLAFVQPNSESIRAAQGFIC